ncbi:hypothetical protein AXF42_Ash017754 [Apostasia shenzhenica]|uniref:Uncharacterized protein n=1 Tax=Apostasia shenzhenica TaxID=1088818 RepID=A0A2I0B664_9ASPA|nr:hypothetical protein AXF42_Ash017754 [Apostasia shenzhenica]
MKRARRGQPPATHLSREITEEVPKKKRGPSEVASPEPPAKRGKGAEQGFVVEGSHDWQQSVEPLYNTNLTGIFGDEDTRIAVRTREDQRSLTVISLPSANQGSVYQREVGLALGSGLESKGLEEKLERTSTPELYSGFANRIATKADNKALREKLVKVAGDKEAVVRERSTTAVEADKTSLPCKQERLDGIRRAWEGLASTLIQGGKITVADLGEVDPFPCMASDPVYKEEGFDLTDDLIHRVFDLLDGVSEG